MSLTVFGTSFACQNKDCSAQSVQTMYVVELERCSTGTGDGTHARDLMDYQNMGIIKINETRFNGDYTQVSMILRVKTRSHQLSLVQVMINMRLCAEVVS